MFRVIQQSQTDPRFWLSGSERIIFRDGGGWYSQGKVGDNFERDVARILEEGVSYARPWAESASDEEIMGAAYWLEADRCGPGADSVPQSILNFSNWSWAESY
jgi:hypothetical protein